LNEWHPNTERFIEIMKTVDFKMWNRFHPKEDFGQAVKRISIEDGNTEENNHPSNEAITIALWLAKKYERMPKYE